MGCGSCIICFFETFCYVQVLCRGFLVSFRGETNKPCAEGRERIGYRGAGTAEVGASPWLGNSPATMTEEQKHPQATRLILRCLVQTTRRIAELKEQECQNAIEDIMYMLIVYKFFKIEVPMVPNLSKLISNRRLELWPSRETDLESIHGPEVLELIREHLTSIVRWVHKNGPKINRSTLRIKRLQFSRIYSASIMFGYFLKSVTIRHRLELTLTRPQEIPPPVQFLNAQLTSTQNHEQEDAIGGSGEMPSSLKPSSVVNPCDLKGYMMGFDPKTLQLCAKLRSCEASNLIEKHSWALFGENKESSQENDEAVILDPPSLKRLLLEAIAFGSFLWDVEDYVDEIYKLLEN